MLFKNLLFCLCLSVSGLCSSAAPPHNLARPNIVLITLDTARADRMGFLGSDRKLTPNLDTLAKGGVVFTHAYSHVPLTTASHATILTGTYPQFNHVNDFGTPLPRDIPTLAEILRADGYHTAAFVGSLVLDPVEGLAPGFDRGFETYDAGFHARRPGDNRYKTVERRAEEVVARATEWLKVRSQHPVFLWVHLYDAHDPYDPPEPFKTRYASAPYDGEIAYVDSALGGLLKQLRAAGKYDNTLITVVADHGEALGDHGETTHGIFLYDETIHVPLLMKMPQGRFAGTRVEARAGLADLMPTILDGVGIKAPEKVQGGSQLIAIQKAHLGTPNALTSDRPVYAETDYPHQAFGWSSLRSLRSGKFLLVEAPREELYDLATDPRAEHNIIETSTAVRDTLKSLLDDFRQKTSREASGAQTADAETQEKLGALGYVASQGRFRRFGVQETGTDPKEKIEIVNALHDAIMDVEETRYADAVPLLEGVLAKEPDIPIAYSQLGTALSWLKQYDKAVPVLRKAVALGMGTGMTRYELGLALFQTGDLEGAATEMEGAVAKSPRWAALHFSLAAVYARLNRADDAAKELKTTTDLKPDDFRANLMLGRVLTLQGKSQEAVSSLRRAVELQPSSVQAHIFLAEAYAAAGQSENAERERQQAERLRGRPPEN